MPGADEGENREEGGESVRRDGARGQGRPDEGEEWRDKDRQWGQVCRDEVRGKREEGGESIW